MIFWDTWCKTHNANALLQVFQKNQEEVNEF